MRISTIAIMLALFLLVGIGSAVGKCRDRDRSYCAENGDACKISSRIARWCKETCGICECVPYSEDACEIAAKKLGWPMKTGEYATKGCYVYEEGSTHYGTVWYGTGGLYYETQKSLNTPKLRPKGFDCYKDKECTPDVPCDSGWTCKEGKCTRDHCVPYSKKACRDAAARLRLQLGDGKHSFEGNYGTKGCYAIAGLSYHYAANVYYGTGGSLEERKKKPTKSHQYRITGDDCYSDACSRNRVDCKDDCLPDKLYGGKPWCNTKSGSWDYCKPC